MEQGDEAEAVCNNTSHGWKDRELLYYETQYLFEVGTSFKFVMLTVCSIFYFCPLLPAKFVTATYGFFKLFDSHNFVSRAHCSEFTLHQIHISLS